MLVLGLSANFILDFVQVALKGIILSSEANSFQQDRLLSYTPLFGAGPEPAGFVLYADQITEVTAASVLSPSLLPLKCHK